MIGSNPSSCGDPRTNSPGVRPTEVAEAVFAAGDLGTVQDREGESGIDPVAAEAVFSELTQSGVSLQRE